MNVAPIRPLAGSANDPASRRVVALAFAGMPSAAPSSPGPDQAGAHRIGGTSLLTLIAGIADAGAIRVTLAGNADGDYTITINIGDESDDFTHPASSDSIEDIRDALIVLIDAGSLPVTTAAVSTDAIDIIPNDQAAEFTVELASPDDDMTQAASSITADITTFQIVPWFWDDFAWRWTADAPLVFDEDADMGAELEHSGHDYVYFQATDPDGTAGLVQVWAGKN